MDFHLKQQFQDAFAAWKDVAFRDETTSQLKSLAWYWIGYENNNLGLFDEACLSFEQALESATGARHLELQRIEIESRFFRNDEPHQLVTMLSQLLSTPHEGSEEAWEAVKKRILSTIGNIYLATGNELRKKSEQTKAIESYTKAKEHFALAGEGEKWAPFGLAEALYWLGDPSAQSILRDKVRPKAVEEEIRRIEPRTKVLARTTELICCIRVPELRHEVHHIHSQVTEALGRVEEGLTVYSEVKRRNVRKDEFRRDLHDLMLEFEEVEKQMKPVSS
jgi:tetratricopeptide (TPR) repeat protein